METVRKKIETEVEQVCLTKNEVIEIIGKSVAHFCVDIDDFQAIHAIMGVASIITADVIEKMFPKEKET